MRGGNKLNVFSSQKDIGPYSQNFFRRFYSRNSVVMQAIGWKVSLCVVFQYSSLFLLLNNVFVIIIILCKALIIDPSNQPTYM